MPLRPRPPAVTIHACNYVEENKVRLLPFSVRPRNLPAEGRRGILATGKAAKQPRCDDLKARCPRRQSSPLDQPARLLGPTLGLAALLSAPAAHADWEYTRWGMTPEQVVAASGGKAELLPEKSRPRVPPLVTAASGEFNVGPLRLRTVFSFDIERGGLACVFYGVTSHEDDEAFKAVLVGRHGQPQSESGLPIIGQTSFGWKTATDEIDASFSKDDPAYAMHCAKGK